MGDGVVERVEEIGQDHAERKAVEVLAQVVLAVFEVQHDFEVEAVDEHVHLQENVLNQLLFVLEEYQLLDVLFVDQLANRHARDVVALRDEAQNAVFLGLG